MESLSTKLHEAVALHREGRLAQAQAFYERILESEPGHFDALHLSGVIAAQTGDPARALALISQAIAINPRSADAFCNLGSAFKALEHHAYALRSYDQAIALRPDYAEAYCCRGSVLGDQRQWPAALESYSRAIELQPSYAEAHFNLGRVQKELGLFDAALSSFDRAIALDPNAVEAHNRKGVLLRELGDRESAMACFERALAVNPDYVHAHLNRGNVFIDGYRLDEALSCYDRAIAIKPDYAEARANRAPILLVRGDFVQGWEDQEWRWKVKSDSEDHRKTNFAKPLWLGHESIAGKTLLLAAVQGIGDTLQFCRYAPLVARLGATVLLRVPRSLVALLSALEGVAAVYGEDEGVPEFDVYCRMTSLPLACRTTWSNLPSQVPYIRSLADQTRRWRGLLGEKVKPRVGLAWASRFRPNEQEGWSVLNHRIIPLVKLAKLALPGIEFLSLQKGQPAESELEQLRAAQWDGPDLIDFTAEMRDFSDTAAVIEHLDLVISVDTSTAHLAGAMGKPVWILLCFDCCWRWLAPRRDSPWYPTAKLYRQERPGDWDGVVDRVRLDLLDWAASIGTPPPGPSGQS